MTRFVAPAVSAVFMVALFFATASRAEAPCDFKGIVVGNRMTPAAVMAALGIIKYKTDPARPSWDEAWPLIKKYGAIPAMELEDWKIGPYCDETECNIPYGVTVGNDNIPVDVLIAFRMAVVTEIDITFNSVFWNDMLPIWDEKYGVDWKAEHFDMPIMDLENKKITKLEGIFLEHITNGMNKATNDQCQIWAQNLDIVFQHHDPIGSYHSVFVIKLVSKNF